MGPPDAPGIPRMPLPPRHAERRETPEGTPRVGKDELARERAGDAKAAAQAIRDEFAEYRREQAESFKELRQELLNELKPIRATVEIHETKLNNIEAGSERRHDMKKTIWTVVGGAAGILVGSLATGWFQYSAAKQQAANSEPTAAEQRQRDKDEESKMDRVADRAVRKAMAERDQRGEPEDTIVAAKPATH